MGALPLAGCFLPPKTGGGGIPQIPGNGSNPQLTISEPPTLGTPVTVTLTFDAVVPDQAKDFELYYRAYIELPPGGYEVLSGEVEQTGQLVDGEQMKVEATVKSIRRGNGSITGWVHFYWGTESDTLFIAIWTDHAEVSDTHITEDRGYPVFDAANPDSDPLYYIPFDEVPEGELKTPPTKAGLAERQASFVDPLVVFGDFSCYISSNDFGHKSEDEEAPIVLGYVDVLNSASQELLGYGFTGIGAGAGEYSITVENPYPDGVTVRVRPQSSACSVRSAPLGNLYSTDYSRDATQMQSVWMNTRNPADNPDTRYKDAWRTSTATK